MAQYYYDTLDTLNDAVLIDALDYEIRVSSLSTAALTNFDGLRVDDAYISVFFDAALSEADGFILDDIIAAHPGIPIPLYEEFIYSGRLVTNIVIWESNLKETKVSEQQFIYTNNRVSQIVTILYDPDNSERSRTTETLTFGGVSIDHNVIAES